jgi:hypothetical protein
MTAVDTNESKARPPERGLTPDPKGGDDMFEVEVELGLATPSRAQLK